MNELFLKLEELGISQEEMEEVKQAIAAYPDEVKEVVARKSDITNLKALILQETDWRKRASLAALLISNEL